MGACLEDEVAFGVENESAHIGHYGAAAGQKHPEGQADLGIRALDHVVEGLAALDLPEGDPVGRERPFNVAVDLKADGVAGGVEQDLEGLDAADVDLDREAAGGAGALVDEVVLVRDSPGVRRRRQRRGRREHGKGHRQAEDDNGELAHWSAKKPFGHCSLPHVTAPLIAVMARVVSTRADLTCPALGRSG